MTPFTLVKIFESQNQMIINWFIPYIFGFVFFIITYILITSPVYEWFVVHSGSSTYARYNISLIIGALVFLIIAYVSWDDEDINVIQ